MNLKIVIKMNELIRFSNYSAVAGPRQEQERSSSVGKFNIYTHNLHKQMNHNNGLIKIQKIKTFSSTLN